MGRISAYQRVRLHSTSSAAVVGHAAEGVMHALAELMDNATKFSPPTEMVHVYVEELTTGVMVTVEDAGLVMSPAALRRAQHAVCNDPLDLGSLSGTRLGLAVVGGLARKHGLTVSFRPSSRGGTGVLTLIPQQLITRPPDGGEGREAGPWRTAVPAQGAGAAGRAPALPTRQPFWTEAPRHAIGPAPDKEPAGEGADVPGPAGPSRKASAPASDEMSVPALEKVPAPLSEEASAPPSEEVPARLDAEVFVLPKRVRGRTMADAAAQQERPIAAPAKPPASRGDDRARGSAPSSRRAGAVPRKPETSRPPPPATTARDRLRAGRPHRRPGAVPPTGRQIGGGAPHPDPAGRPRPRCRPPTATSTGCWRTSSSAPRAPGTPSCSPRTASSCATSAGLSVDQADQLAAIASGIQSLSHGASIEFGDGTGGVRQSMTEFHGGLLFIVGGRRGRPPRRGGRPRTPTPGVVGHNISELVEQLGEYLTRAAAAGPAAAAGMTPPGRRRARTRTGSTRSPAAAAGRRRTASTWSP